MDFKKLLKNKFVIALIINLILIIIAACLVPVSYVFYGITALLACSLCLIVCVMYFYNLKNINNNIGELVPLTDIEQKNLEKENKRKKRYTIIKIVSFAILAITFFIVACEML